jgi:phage terminase Nu1 subunit (DNA packaging protein)
MALMITNDQSANPVSASALAAHLDCSRAYIAKLEAEGVLHRDGGGFDLDASRVAYLRFLRRERRQSPRGEADADFQRAKAQLIRIRIAEKQRELMPTSAHNQIVDEMCGLVLSRLSGFAARCGGRDLRVRREIDQAVHDLRVEIAQAATTLADLRGEPAEMTQPRGGP